MALREKLDEDLKSAMRAKDSLRMNTVRALKSAIKYREIELMKPLDDAGILGVVATEIKRRRDSVEQYRAGNRADLADKEEAEIKILQEFLPQQLTREEVEAKVAEVITRVGAQGPKDATQRFYMAVCLYESGDRPSAAAIAASGLEKLPRSPFVEGYLKKLAGGAP
jgi:hypothetical protein